MTHIMTKNNHSEYSKKIYSKVLDSVNGDDSIKEDVLKIGLVGSVNDNESVASWSDLDILFILKSDSLGNINTDILLKLRELNELPRPYGTGYFCGINEITDLSDPWADNDSQKQTFTHFFSNNPKKCPFITFTKDEYLTPLKDDLEPAKHKALDFIGDIIFLGAIPKARFEIYKPGHAFNRKIVKTISNLKKSERETFDYFLSIIPEALSLKECVENNIVHKDCSVLDHTKMVFLNMMDIVPDEASFLEKGKLFRLKLAIFLHDFGKLHTLSINDDGSTTCAGHEVVSYNKVLENNFLDRFSITEEGKVWILNFIKKHADLHILFDESDNVLRDAFLSFKKDNPGSYMETLIFSIADLKGTHFKEHNKEEYDRRINFLEKLLSEEL
jgi:hypothetical protein